jgi:uncharacterized membrane protein
LVEEEVKEVVLFEDEVSDLKAADKAKRWGRAVLLLVGQMALLLALYLFLRLIGLFIGMILLFFVIPSPFISAPNRYRVTNLGLSIDRGTLRFSSKLKLGLKINRERRYVAILRKNREIMWLYSHDVERLYNVLTELIAPKPESVEKDAGQSAEREHRH